MSASPNLTSSVARHIRPVRSFVIRHPPLPPMRRQQLAAEYPLWGLPYAPTPMNLAHAFGRNGLFHLEIGYGTGEALAERALRFPQINFLGIEVYPPGICSMLTRIKTHALTNVRLIAHDALEVLRSMIVPDSFAEIGVFFPDPWPKRRHHKRRLLHPHSIQLLAQRLAPEGRLLIATDHDGYAEVIARALSGETNLRQHQRHLLSPTHELSPPDGFGEALGSRFAKRAGRLQHSFHLFTSRR